MIPLSQLLREQKAQFEAALNEDPEASPLDLIVGLLFCLLVLLLPVWGALLASRFSKNHARLVPVMWSLYGAVLPPWAIVILIVLMVIWEYVRGTN